VAVIAIRKARAADVAGIAEIHIASWRSAYRGILSDDLLDSLSISEREESWQALTIGGGKSWLTLVAVDDGALIGFCALSLPSRDADAGERTAEIAALYVAPSFFRKGAGSAMIEAAVDQLRGQSWRHMTLWVLPENERALTFYAGHGFEVEAGIEKREERSGRAVIRMRTEL
jgi:ribosomal protein S18 acetylase RimI-like enzyme